VTKQVLITGSEGVVGRALSAEAKARSYTVVSMDSVLGHNLYTMDMIYEFQRLLRSVDMVMLCCRARELEYANWAIALLRNRCEPTVLVTFGSMSTYMMSLAQLDQVDQGYIDQKKQLDELISWQQSEQIRLDRWNPWIMHVRPGIIDCAAHEHRRPPKLNVDHLAQVVWMNIDAWTGVRELVLAYQPGQQGQQQ
jgi:hypothetical protein